MSALAVPLIIAGAGVQAYSSYQQGQAQKEQAKFQAQQAESRAKWQDYNAKVAEREAEAQRQAMEIESAQQRRQAKQIKGRQRAIYGASGVTMEGPPLLVAEDTAAQLELENSLLRTAGNRKAMMFEQQSMYDRADAAASRSTSRMYQSSSSYYGQQGAWGAAGSLLSGAGQASYMSSQMSNPSVSAEFEGMANKADNWLNQPTW